MGPDKYNYSVAKHCMFISPKTAHLGFCELPELYSERSIRTKKENIAAVIFSRVA